MPSGILKVCLIGRCFLCGTVMENYDLKNSQLQFPVQKDEVSRPVSTMTYNKLLIVRFADCLCNTPCTSFTLTQTCVGYQAFDIFPRPPRKVLFGGVGGGKTKVRGTVLENFENGESATELVKDYGVEIE